MILHVSLLSESQGQRVAAGGQRRQEGRNSSTSTVIELELSTFRMASLTPTSRGPEHLLPWELSVKFFSFDPRRHFSSCLSYTGQFKGFSNDESEGE